MTLRRSLTSAQVREAKSLYVPGKVGYETIARHFAAQGVKVGVSTIRDILTGRTGYAA